MSVKYSNSPTLHLAIADSRSYRCCQYLFLVALGLATYGLATGGYPLVGICFPLLPFAGYRLRRQPLVGAVLTWHRGQWRLRKDGVDQPIALLRGHCLPWVTYVGWREQCGRVGGAWLFADSTDRQQLRRLRVRLKLQG